MWISGRLSPDAPDPRVEMAERVRALPFPVYGLAPQPTIEDLDSLGYMGGGVADHGRRQLHAVAQPPRGP